MRHAWLRVLLAIALTAVIGGCDSSQKQGPDTKTPDQPEGQQQQTEDTPEMSDKNAADAEANSGAAAAEQKQSAQSLWVMQPRGNRQCEGGGKSLESSGAELAQNGIRVQESRCGVRTDRMYPSVCGGATGDLLMHRIPASFLDAALELGYDPAKTGQYKFVDCPQMQPSAPRDM